MNSRVEAIVGAFVLIGVLALAYLAIQLGKLEVLGNTGYVVVAEFASVAGLKTGDPVEIAGVKVGRVESIGLAGDRARLTLRVDNGVPLQEDVIASVRARGLIGDKYIMISPGASERLLRNGDKIRETESPPDVADLIARIVGGDLTKSEGK